MTALTYWLRNAPSIFLYIWYYKCDCIITVIFCFNATAEYCPPLFWNCNYYSSHNHSQCIQHQVLHNDEPEVLSRKPTESHIQTNVSMQSTAQAAPACDPAGVEAAEPYRVHRCAAAALALRTNRDQRHRCRADLGRQHCVREPASAVGHT